MQGMRKIIGCLCMILMMETLTGCGASFPELTEEESNLISEYAVNLLMKYDKNAGNRLVADPEAALEKKRARDAAVEAMKVKEQAETDTAEAENTSNNGQTVQTESNTLISSIGSFLGLAGMEIQYSGYEVDDSYAEDAESQSYFSLDATQGKKLLVLKFQVNSTDGADKELDMASLQTEFKLTINGTDTRYAQSTLLLNDLVTFRGTIPGNGGKELVLIQEITPGAAESLSSVTLTLAHQDATGTISLQ
ncbi:MAG: hypothetical protein PHP50_14880 [Lachnospiraceae bacterium]|nr:hypothetical protein [Lachnospiraceae bacterium]